MSLRACGRVPAFEPDSRRMTSAGRAPCPGRGWPGSSTDCPSPTRRRCPRIWPRATSNDRPATALTRPSASGEVHTQARHGRDRRGASASVASMAGCGCTSPLRTVWVRGSDRPDRSTSLVARSLGIVGESGLGQVGDRARASSAWTEGSSAEVSGEIWFEGRELVACREGDIRALRGNEMAMIFQDPLSSLTRSTRSASRSSRRTGCHNQGEQGRSRAGVAVEDAGTGRHPNPDKLFDDYPTPVLGRYAASARCSRWPSWCDPKRLIADEPTTRARRAVQAQILELMKDAARVQLGISSITHDLGVVARRGEASSSCTGGQCVEQAR